MKKFSILATILLTVAVAAWATVLAGTGGQPPIKVGPIAVVAQDDIGSCNNVWAEDYFNKFYTITLNRDETYNVNVKYKDGIFVTNAGTSPGACISGTDNGNTVAAGVFGRTHQEYNRTLSGILKQGATCGPECITTTTILNTLFESGWIWVDSDWSWEAHYEAGSNGTYFDTRVNWPLNNRGDITGSPR